MMRRESLSGRRPRLGDPDFAARLGQLKKKAGLSDLELCAWLGGISKSTIGSWNRGERRPHWYTADRLSKALDYLEKEISARNAQLPVPPGIRQNDRLNYVKAVRANYPTL